MELTIGELARRSGVRASTIRYWERIGVLPEPSRLRGRRRYAATALESLRVIRLAQQAGFTLRELRALRATTRGSRSGGWRAALAAKRVEVERRLSQLARSDRLLEMALGCRCTDLRACLSARLRAGDSI
jgi:MerR family transcriptional regulator, redox-sensitive transcriptional activator SoxR